MRTKDLSYYLPPELIAQVPCRIRSNSKLLILDRSNSRITDSHFHKIPEFLLSGDCLVLNNIKVRPARFFIRRITGGRLEGLFLKETASRLWQVLLKNARRLRPQETIYLESNKGKAPEYKALVLESLGEGTYTLKTDTDERADAILEKIGFPPLPPYIKRDRDPQIAKHDRQRYQTVYARNIGAIAAPTAGLHFTQGLLERLRQKGICIAYITLHIGLGTFKPVTAETIEDHNMHTEQFCIDKKNARIINNAKQKRHRIIAVGTTSVRALESAATNSHIHPYSGSTRLFITPGYKFKITDAMITNFHLPRSTLLALVAAFAGLENTFSAYKHAIENKYRFYSYGDAMLIL